MVGADQTFFLQSTVLCLFLRRINNVSNMLPICKPVNDDNYVSFFSPVYRALFVSEEDK